MQLRNISHVDQHRLEREIRAMLRRARRTEDLEAVPLARDLCNTLGITNASVMLRDLVDAAFSDTPAEAKLRKLVFECDLDGTTTQEGAARSLNVSRRQFHRLRTQAVRIIGKQVLRILVDTTDDIPRDDIEQLARSLAPSRPEAASKIFSLASSSAVATRLQELRARLDAGVYLDEHATTSFPLATRPAALVLVAQSRLLSGEGATSIDPILREIEDLTSRLGRGYDDVTRFELEYLNFLRAKSRSDAVAMRSSARSLERFSGERKMLHRRAIAASAEAALRCGDVSEARRLTTFLQAHSSAAHDVRHLASASLLNAAIHFFEGSYHKAEIAARAARVALAPHFPDVLRAELLLGRIALAAETAWEPDEGMERTSTGSWERCAISVVYSRYLLRHDDHERARMYASDAADRARRDGFYGLAAHAFVTLGAIEDRAGNEAKAQSYYQRALVEFAEVFDALLGSDLFIVPAIAERAFGPLASIEAIIEPLLMRMKRVIPDLLFSTNTIELWRTFFAALLRDDTNELDRVRDDPSLLRIMTRHGSAIADALAAFVAPILPRRRQAAFIARVRETLRLVSNDTSNVPTIAHARGMSEHRLEA